MLILILMLCAGRQSPLIPASDIDNRAKVEGPDTVYGREENRGSLTRLSINLASGKVPFGCWCIHDGLAQ